jgi:hypothetical protein
MDARSGRQRTHPAAPAVRSLPWQGRISHSYNEHRIQDLSGRRGSDGTVAHADRDRVGARRVAPTYGDPNDPHSTSYDAAGAVPLWYDPEQCSLSVFAERIKGFTIDGTPALIEQIGTRFNAILMGGAHQREFTTYTTDR